MKYYLSTFSVADHDSNRDYLHRALVAATNEAHALRLSQAHAARFDGTHGREVAGGYRFGEADGRGYTVCSHALTEVSPSTFDELLCSMPVFGDNPGNPTTQEPAEAVKTLACRLGAQLTKRGVKISHSQLLHAIAASLGKTDWQKLVHQPVARASRWPRGEWPTTPLREADTLAFVDRVNALWLTHGDVELAAKLLHVAPDALMNSFKTAGEADTAFCGRLVNWLPEHSLAPNLSASSEGYRFRIVTTPLENGRYQVDGYVGERRVISLDNRLDPMNWYLGLASALPCRDQEALIVTACFNAALHRATDLLNRAAAPIDQDN